MMSETCHNCAKIRMKVGCNCFDADSVPFTKIEEYNYAHQGSTTFFELLVDLIPPEELDAIAEEESYDPNDEIDNHEYM